MPAAMSPAPAHPLSAHLSNPHPAGSPALQQCIRRFEELMHFQNPLKFPKTFLCYIYISQ